MSNNQIPEKVLREDLIGNSRLVTFSRNYLIEAGAGSGKTYTMVNRIINQLLKGIAKPEEIVAITFTEKATQEMLGRIDSTLRDKLVAVTAKFQQLAASGNTTEREKLIKQKEKIQQLIDDIGLMQISTIHSFCQKLLATMPFYSEVGPGFTVMDEDEARVYARNFYNEHIACKEAELQAIADITDFKYEEIREQFLKYCNEISKLACPSGDYVTLRKEILFQCKALVELFIANDLTWRVRGFLWLQQQKDFEVAFKTALDQAAKQKKLEEAQELKDFATVLKRGKFEKLEAIMLQLQQLQPSEAYELLSQRVQENSNNEAFVSLLKEDEPAFFEYLKVHGIDFFENVKKVYKKVKPGQEKELEELKLKWPTVCFRALYPFLLQQLETYKKHKLEDKKLTENDLIYYSCKMLHTSAKARKYFHQRYKYFYVDEMQDTDLVQTQLLFYLTTAEEDFCASDWKQCKPVPGSLFLVGDPKQAIYRFRGGDITVYNVLRELFTKGGIGKCCNLVSNRRSTEEICEFVNQTFPEATATTYQAQFLDMTALSGKGQAPAVIKYMLDGTAEDLRKADAEKVADYIQAMVEQKQLLGAAGNAEEGIDGNIHEAKYSDFLIITKDKADTVAYAQELSRRHIPCNMTGKRRLAAIPVISRIKAVLELLLDFKDKTKLVLVLNKCYGITLADIAAYKLLLGSLIDSGVKAKQLLEECVKQGKLADMQRFEGLLAALEELQQLRALIAEKSGLAVLEELIDNSNACWLLQNKDRATNDYATTRQLLDKVKSKGAVSFVEAARTALAIANGILERELNLNEAADCVRIMNLHKAKGLEAEVIILAYAEKKEYGHEQHSVESNNEILEHICWNNSKHPKACVDGWVNYCDEEQKFAEAEAVRLLYVAATRPKSRLVICGYSKSLSNKKPENKSYWYELFKDLPETALPAPADQTPAKGAAAGAGATPTVSKAALQAALETKVSSANERSLLQISPSLLDHGTRSQKDQEDSNADSASKGQSMEANKPTEPYGKDWGTIIHRILELSLKKKAYAEAQVRAFAVQAILETVAIDALNAEQRQKLLSDKQLDDPLGYLEEKAYAFVKPALAEKSDLRSFLEGAQGIFTEIPLAVYEEEPEFVELIYGALQEADKPEQDNLPIAMNGIIDLAVKKEDGWYIIDYKTDILHKDEAQLYAATKDSSRYEERLRKEYANQLTCYKTILERKGYTVKGLYLCALILGGKLLKLEPKY